MYALTVPKNQLLWCVLKVNASSFVITCTLVIITAMTTPMGTCVNIFTEFIQWGFYNQMSLITNAILSHMVLKMGLGVTLILMTPLNLLKVWEILAQVHLLQSTYALSIILYPSITDPTLQLKMFQSYMKELERTVVLENATIHAVLPHINSLLHNAVLTCTAAMSVDTSCAEQFKSEKIAPNQKWWQWRFKKTTIASFLFFLCENQWKFEISTIE